MAYSSFRSCLFVSLFDRSAYFGCLNGWFFYL
jgi:hypothetical protein